MTRGLRRRDLLTSSGAALGAALLGGMAGRKAAGAVVTQRSPRWGIAVDLARCASRDGCRQCIDACHAAHRVPTVKDPRHEIKWVWKEPFARVFPEQVHGYEAEAQRQMPVLVACNHCRNAPCTKVCPTGATWRRSDGVVAMDEHRCIGCRYCMAACPYGARSFNWEKSPDGRAGRGSYPARTAGVVEKCTLCVERLDVGQEPLCVEVCRRAGPAALTFGDLEDEGSPLRRTLATRQVLRRKAALGTEPSVFYLVG
jgi:Fe-S-cluster-containing dehydrogenase component